MRNLAFNLLFLALCSPMFAQTTVTFTTNGGPCCQYVGYTVVTEDGQSVAGASVHIATPYGYSQSAVILPNNPTAPGEWLNPVINITSTTYTGNPGDATRTVSYTFNSIENLYGYTWSGSFTAQLVCVQYWRGLCSKHVPGTGSGSMTATPVTQ